MTDTEIRTKTSPLMDKLIAAVRQHAETHYAEGWDPIVEAYEDADLVRLIGYCRTEKGAIAAVAKVLDVRASVAHDIRASSGEYDDVPPPAPVPTELDEQPVAVCGCPIAVLEDEGHQEGCSEFRRAGGLDRFGTDGVAAAAMALAEGADLDETPLTVEEEAAVEAEQKPARKPRAPRGTGSRRRKSAAQWAEDERAAEAAANQI